MRKLIVNWLTLTLIGVGTAGATDDACAVDQDQAQDSSTKWVGIYASPEDDYFSWRVIAIRRVTEGLHFRMRSKSDVRRPMVLRSLELRGTCVITNDQISIPIATARMNDGELSLHTSILQYRMVVVGDEILLMRDDAYVDYCENRLIHRSGILVKVSSDASFDRVLADVRSKRMEDLIKDIGGELKMKGPGMFDLFE